MAIFDRKHFSILALLLIGLPLAAFSQQTTDEEADEEEPAPEAASIDEVVVTGSRIKRTEFSSTAPITIITSERSQLAGLLDATEILQSSTVASGQQIDGSLSGFVFPNEGGIGANSISLRGLGAQRTLVLVNGKRWGPSGVRGATNSVDLTAIPTSLIARYEILKDGASSIYGADAVAGVVNAITKERIDGSVFNVQTYIPEDGGAGYTLDGAWGRVGDNWSFNVSASYAAIDNTTMTDRDFSRCDTRPRIDGSNIDPDTGQELCFGFIYGLGAFGPFGFMRYEPSLTDVNDTSNPFYDGGIQGFGIPLWTRVPLNSNPNQGPFYRDDRDWAVREIQPEGDIISVNSFADYDFDIAGRNATVYYEFYYNDRSTESNASGYRQFFPLVPASNPTNPVGTNSPLAVFGGFRLAPVLPSYELQGTTSIIDVERTQTFVGLRGDISDKWTYDTYLGYSWSDGTYEDENWLQDRVDASLNAVLDGSGNLVCSPESITAFPDCVAGDLFTEDALLRGILPQDYLDFISKTTVGQTEYTSQQFSGYVTGPLFNLPAGELQTVLGFEYRREEIDDQPDIEAQNDNYWGFSSAGITAGTDTVREFFVEVEAPLLSDLPAAENLTLNMSWRYTDYNSYGSDDTHRLSLNYQILPSLRLRATTGTSFRAPDIFEQFLGDITGFLSPFGVDPCIQYGDNFDPDSLVFQNCASQGLPPDLGSGGGPSLRTVTGGNADLKAETSDATTYGIVIQPEWLGASLAVSWFDIDIANTVASPTIGFILADCYTSPNLSSPFCSRVGPRDVNGFLTDVDASVLNVGLLKTEGYDVDLLYEHEFSTFDFTLDLTATYIDEQQRELFGQVDDFERAWGFPDWTATVDLRVDWRDWTFFWNVFWIDKTREQPAPNRICETDDKTYHAFTTRYRGSDWEILGTVRNIADTDPPIVSDGCGSQSASRVFNTIPGTGYDLMGRSYIIQASKSFDF